MNFLRPSVFVFHTDDSNLKFQPMNKRCVHHETYKRIWDNLIPNFAKHFFSKIENFSCQFSLRLLYNVKPEYTVGSLRCYDPLKQ